MRLTAEQAKVIRQSARELVGADAVVYLFGSRVDDSARGGDIDLYIETPLSPEEAFAHEQRLYATLQRQIGPRKIDLIVRSLQSPKRAIHQHALERGLRL